MGYNTDFSGKFILNKPLDDETYTFLKKLSETRRMKRNVEGYGIEGEFYVDGKGPFGQDQEDTIIEYNAPPSTQPGLWCHWIPSEDRMSIEWNESEKFYGYIEWIEYIIEKVLIPKGYVLNGEVEWTGDERDDIGLIRIKNNIVTPIVGKIVYEEEGGDNE